MQLPPELLENLQSLIPVLIFIVWLVIFVLGAIFKKRGAQPPVAAGSSPRNQERAPERDLSDNLRRSLEDIFGVPQEEDQQYQEQVSYSTESPKEKLPKTAYDENRFKRKRIPRVASVPEVVMGIPYEWPAVSIDMTIEEVRKGIIWSEVLQPPLSLRE